MLKNNKEEQIIILEKHNSYNQKIKMMNNVINKNGKNINQIIPRN